MSRGVTVASARAGAGLLAWSLLVAFVVAGLMVPGTGSAAADPATAQAKQAFAIKSRLVTTSSGLTRDPADNLYWTVNASGDSGRAIALDETGAVQGSVKFRADLVDVEAVQYAGGALYVADIGDRSGDRDHVTVYVLYDLQPNDSTVRYHAYDFRYPDGPHDAQALLISPAGQLYLVTSQAKGGIYRAPAEPSRSEVNTLTRVGDAPPYVTDGQFLADGRIALRSYVDVSVLDPQQDYKVVARAATPYQPRGASLTQSLDGSALLVGSGGSDSVVYRMPVPTALRSAPTPGASPPPSPASSPSAAKSPGASTTTATSSPSDQDPGGSTEADQDTDVDQNSRPGSSGTIAALLIAAGVAVAAGVGVHLARGRQERP